MPKKFACILNGHNYKLVRDVATHQEHIECTRCGRSFDIYDTDSIESEWDEGLEEVVHNFHTSRTEYFDMLAGRATELH